MLKMNSNTAFLEKLYTENYAMVHRLITRTLRQRGGRISDAADLVQEVFVLAAKRIDVLRAHPNPAGWLIKTAQYMCMNYISANARHREQLFESLELHAERADVIAEIDTLVSLEQVLKPEDYALLKAYCIEKRSTEDICRETGLSPNRLRVRMHRLRKHLSPFFVFLVIFASTHNI